MMKRIISLSLLLLSICQVWAFEESKYYAIHRNGESASYIYAVGDKMNTGALNAQDGNFIWQFIPTGKSDCYYVKNVLTEMYVQTTAPLNSLVKLGENPVEIMISRGAGTTGTGTTYFFASTDQGSINYNADATLGLNKGASGVVAYYIKTGRGNSYWEIEEVSYTPSAPTPPAEEQEDVCASIPAYRLPCGTYSAKTRLSKIEITGEGVLNEIHFSPSATGRYTVYAKDRAELMPAGKVQLSAKLVGAEEDGLVVTIWADFDGDGQFETNVTPDVAEQIEAEFTVPETQALQGRFRIRVDQSGGVTPNADFYGTMYDVPFVIVELQTQRTLSVATNDAMRGTAKIQGVSENVMSYERGAEVTVEATPAEGYFFHGWQKGRIIVSMKTTYTTTMTENKNLVALFGTTECVNVEDEEDDGTYPTNFPKNTSPTRTDRQLNAVSITVDGEEKQTLKVNANRAYNNLTTNAKNVFVCKPNDFLKATFDYSGSWMHGYVFVDENNDQQFSFVEGNVNQEGTEVKSFSFYSGSFEDAANGVNSVGTQLTGQSRNTMDCPVFNAPKEVGLYRIRFKVDWNSVDPAGQLAADGTCTGTNGILANGGYIVDALLQVGDVTDIERIETNQPHSIYTIDGRKVQGVKTHDLPSGFYIIDNQKMYVK